MQTNGKKNIKHERIIDKIQISERLPTVIFLAGIHGNELSGIKALNSVINTIRANHIQLNGNMIALRGNLKAIALRERFIDIDLNRAWTNNNIKTFQKNINEISEAEEVIQLKKEIDTIIHQAKAPVLIVDLHTTSSQSNPFTIFDDTLRNREIANILPVTKVLGITEKLKGTILGYYGDKGPRTLVFEAGQHDEASSIEHHISAIWLIMFAHGVFMKQQIDYNFHYERLKKAAENAPKLVETILRYSLQMGDVFRMEEGFSNFTKVNRGTLLAIHNNKKVFAEKDCYVFMPLYQSKGEDGYFLVKKISKIWLNISNLLRKLQADRIITIFPGIRKYHPESGTYLVNTKIASFKAIDFIHLLGFRLEKKLGNQLLFSKHPYDLYGPWDK